LSRIFVCVLHSDFTVTEVSEGLPIRSIDIMTATKAHILGTPNRNG